MPDGRTLFGDAGAPPTIFRKNLTTGGDESVPLASGTFQCLKTFARRQDATVTQRGAGGVDIRMFALTDRARRPEWSSRPSTRRTFASRDGRHLPDSNIRRPTCMSSVSATGATTRIDHRRCCPVESRGGAVLLTRWPRQRRSQFKRACRPHGAPVPLFMEREAAMV
jgi:hypothetical protein